MKFLWSALFLSINIYAVEPYQLSPQSMIPVCDSSKIELRNLPTIRDQGSYGLCYAHSTIILMDYLRCSHVKNPEACYQQKGSVLHLAGFNTYTDRITIGGYPRMTLNRFSHTRKLIPEECAEYDNWEKLRNLYSKERRELKLQNSNDADEVDYFYYISNRLKTSKVNHIEKGCWAQELINAGIEQTAQDIMAILNKGHDLHWQELRHQLLIPSNCQYNSISYPDFKTLTYPSNKDLKSPEGFRNFIFSSLSEGIPLEASFKSSNDTYHSTVIAGQRHVCDYSGCELQYKIQNSYGKRWQERNNDGWVNAENFVDHMSEDGLGVMAVLPKEKKIFKNRKSPLYHQLPSNAKMSIGSEECWTVKASRSYEIKPFTFENTGEQGLWKCEKDGKISYRQFAAAGANCKKI